MLIFKLMNYSVLGFQAANFFLGFQRNDVGRETECIGERKSILVKKKNCWENTGENLLFCLIKQTGQREKVRNFHFYFCPFGFSFHPLISI